MKRRNTKKKKVSRGDDSSDAGGDEIHQKGCVIVCKSPLSAGEVFSPGSSSRHRERFYLHE